MSIVRQDAWTNDEDLTLAEVVLRHIREGSTQLAAFEEVGERLSRTAAACGFRWNSTIRKKYEAAIAIAKKQRKKIKKTKLEEVIKKPMQLEEQAEEIAPKLVLVDKEKEKHEGQLTIDGIIEFLQVKKAAFTAQESLATRNQELAGEVAELRAEKGKLQQQLSKLQTNYNVIEQDYKFLIGIMDRAKQMAVEKA